MITFVVRVGETDEAYQVDIESTNMKVSAELLLAVSNTFAKAALAVAANAGTPAEPVLLRGLS